MSMRVCEWGHVMEFVSGMGGHVNGYVPECEWCTGVSPLSFLRMVARIHS